ncbi:MAG TPA: vanadium-dependent haloperoxidase [Steroidobacteraceae bacterium]|nr:vanadium-dependent haloperoxidase [Steroidobacteraceae bacterium]
MTHTKLFHGLLLGVLLGNATPVLADAVVDWNEITVQAVTAGRPGPVGAVDIALVQVAVHDAVQAIEQRFEPYHVEIGRRDKRLKGRLSGAVAAAAHGVLVGMYPTQAASLDVTFYNYLADKGLNGDPAVLIGQQVAARILPLRRVNPNPLPPPFVGGSDVGVWRPTPSFLGNPPVPAPFSAMAASWMAEFDPFTLTSPTRFRAPSPPALTSERYAHDYNEVKALGALVGSTRTAEQTDLAYFYSDNTPALWNRALRGIATRQLRRSGDTARLFALASLATADALISSWDSKKFYNLWRPITAIHDGDTDGNPATGGDPAWQSLINNPNYPDYTSGANNVTAAMTRTLELYFGTDKMVFEVSSLAPQAVRKTRRYFRFSDAAQDVVDARVYLGIHFRFADVAARTQGLRVADWTFNHFLLPLGGREHHGHD